MQTSIKALAILAASVTGAVLAAPASGATYRFDNNGGDGLFETGNNWLDSVAVVRAVPGSADIADISNSYTVGLSSARTLTELIVGHPNSSASTLPGVATLNIGTGTVLSSTSTNGVRVGRAVQTGQLVGSSQGRIIQTAGTFSITSGTNGLRLSQGDSGIVADSLYRISGGSVLGGATIGTAFTAPLQVGNIANQFNRAEFHISGSGATTARFEDVRVAGGSNVGSQAVLHFSIDSGGVTALVAEDELRFTGTGTNSLEIDLIGAAPESAITLITADRLTTASSAPAETFTGLPNLSPIVRNFGGFAYTYQLQYQDGSDDGVLDAFVRLNFVSKIALPEPASLTAALGGLTLLRRRRA